MQRCKGSTVTLLARFRGLSTLGNDAPGRDEPADLAIRRRVLHPVGRRVFWLSNAGAGSREKFGCRSNGSTGPPSPHSPLPFLVSFNLSQFDRLIFGDGRRNSVDSPQGFVHVSDVLSVRKKIRIDFCDFRTNFNKADNFLFNLLAERFDVELCDQPDFLIYSCYGHEHRLHSGVRIFFSGESDAPDYRVCDYSLACLKVDDPRHLQLPLYTSWGDSQDIIKKNDDPDKILAAKTKFCSFIISGYNRSKNHNRVAFFEKLSRYKRVDSGGRKFNNIGGPIPPGTRNKIEFLRSYKFNIAFENRSLPGYTTEKIFEPMVARCLPIYWGNPLIKEEFNPKSFLNYFDYPNEDALIEKIIELDKDNSRYLEYVRQPYFYDDKPNVYCSRERILEFFDKIFSTRIAPVAQAGRKGFSFGRLFGRWKLAKRHHWHPINPPTWK